jgi:hypothetical protein
VWACVLATTLQVLRCRFVNRVLPVTHTCFAGLEEMKAMAPKLVAPAFPEGREQVPSAGVHIHRHTFGVEWIECIVVHNAVLLKYPMT